MPLGLFHSYEWVGILFHLWCTLHFIITNWLWEGIVFFLFCCSLFWGDTEVPLQLLCLPAKSCSPLNALPGVLFISSLKADFEKALFSFCSVALCFGGTQKYLFSFSVFQQSLALLWMRSLVYSSFHHKGLTLRRHCFVLAVALCFGGHRSTSSSKVSLSSSKAWLSSECPPWCTLHFIIKNAGAQVFAAPTAL